LSRDATSRIGDRRAFVEKEEAVAENLIIGEIRCVVVECG
jgi:hypothetical protein